MASQTTIARLLIALEADVKGLKTSLTTVKSQFKNMSTTVGKQVDIMKKHWIGLTIVVSGGVFAFNKMFKIWSGFSQRMAEVNTLLNLQQSEYKKLKQSILDMTRVVPQTADELGAAQYQIVSAGVQDAADSLMVLQQSAKAAVAGVTDTKAAAMTGMAVINAYGKDISELGDIYDILFQTIKEGVTTFPEIAQSLGVILPIARSANESFDDMAAAFAAMTKAGLSTPEATTALSRALQSLGAPQQKARKEMKKLGIEWKGFIPTVTKISEVLKAVPKEDRLATLQKIIPNIRAAKGILALANNMDILNDTLEKMENRAGAMEKAYDIMAQTPENRVKAFTNVLVELTNKVMEFAGVAFIDELRNIQSVITSFIEGGGAQKLGEQFGVLVKWVMKFITFVAQNWQKIVILGISLKLVGIANAVLSLVTALGALNVALLTNPYTAAAALIIGLGLAFMQADKHAKEFKKTLQETIPNEAKEALQKYLVELESLYAKQEEALPQFKSGELSIGAYTKKIEFVTKRIKELESNIGGDFGIEFTGSPENKIKQLNKVLDELLNITDKPIKIKTKIIPDDTDTTPTKPLIEDNSLLQAKSAMTLFKEAIKTELLELENAYANNEVKIQEFFRRRILLVTQVRQKELDLVKFAITQADTETEKIKLRTTQKQIEANAEREIIKLYQDKAKALSDLNTKQAQIKDITSEAQERGLIEKPSFGKSAFAIEQEQQKIQLTSKHDAEMEALLALTKDKEEHDKLRRAHFLEAEKLTADQTKAIWVNNLNNMAIIVDGWSNLLAEMYQNSGEKAKGFFYFSKALAAAEVAISTQAGIMKAYEQGGIYGGAQAVLIAAQGGAALGKILAETIQGLAAGGLVNTGTTGTADDVLAWVSKGEHVTKKSSVDYYGKGFMQAVNNKTFPKSLLAGMNFTANSNASKNAYQSGGGVTASSNAGIQEMQIVNIVDPKMIDKYMSSNAGKRTVLNVMADNAYEVKRILRT